MGGQGDKASSACVNIQYFVLKMMNFALTVNDDELCVKTLKLMNFAFKYIIKCINFALMLNDEYVPESRVVVPAPRNTHLTKQNPPKKAVN